MVRPLTLLLIILITVTLPVCSQQHVLRHYDTDDGLPSLKIFDLKHGYDSIMWFATESGLYSFDGYYFYSYEEEEEADNQSNTLLRLYDDNNKIWFSSDENKIGFVKNESINMIKDFSTKIKEIDTLFEIENAFVDNLHMDSQNILWISTNNRKLYKMSSDGIISEVPVPQNSSTENYTIRFFKNNDKYLWQWINEPLTNNNTDYQVVDSDLYLNFGCEKSFHKRTRLLQINNDEFIFTYNQRIFHFKNNNLDCYNTFEKEIIDVYFDADNNQTWVCFLDGGVSLFKECKFRDNYISFLKDKTVTGVEKDFQGNIWFSTDDDGVFSVNNLSFLQYSFGPEQKNNYITSMYSTNNLLYIATIDGKIRIGQQYENSNLSFEILNINKPLNNRIRYLYEHKNGDLYIAENKLIKYTGDTTVNITYNEREIYCHAITGLSDGSIAIAHFNNIGIIKSDDEKHTQSISFPNIRVRILFEDITKKLWVGSSTGLYYYNNDNNSPIPVTDSILSKNYISDIKQTADYLIVATRHNGIYILKDNEQFIALTKKDDFKNKNITHLFIENDTCFWLSSDNSYSRIIIDNENDSILSLNHFNYEDGLPSINITDIKGLGNLLLLSTAKGLVTCQPDQIPLLTQSTQPKIIRRSINNIDRTIYEDLILKTRENELELEFQAIEYRNPANVKYFYKLEGADDDWIPTEERIIRYPNLSPGTYKFNMKAIDFHGNENFLKGPHPTIKIKKRFIETTIFYILITTFLISLLIIIFFISFGSLKKREILKRQMLMAERKSLLSQMNPHFIFNSLNSIQHFFVNRNEKLAHTYLSKLSSLIRRILEYSKINNVILLEELETIKLYLGLEKLRFEEKFDYIVDISKNIDINKILIPPMLLQPCLENSIIHGLLPKKSKGKLILAIYPTAKNEIRYVIEDDGIGIKKSMEITKRSSIKESMGLTNIKDRIRLINSIEKTSIKFSIENLYSEGKPSGTRVIIIIPNKPD